MLTAFCSFCIIYIQNTVSFFPRPIKCLWFSPLVLEYSRHPWGGIYKLFMELKSWVQLTPTRPGQLGRYSAEDLIGLNSSEFKNLTSGIHLLLGTCLYPPPRDTDPYTESTYFLHYCRGSATWQHCFLVLCMSCVWLESRILLRCCDIWMRKYISLLPTFTVYVLHYIIILHSPLIFPHSPYGYISTQSLSYLSFSISLLSQSPISCKYPWTLSLNIRFFTLYLNFFYFFWPPQTSFWLARMSLYKKITKLCPTSNFCAFLNFLKKNHIHTLTFIHIFT